jgi:hypothetical protein
MNKFTLGIYKTHAAAVEGLTLWLDVYAEDDLSIEFDGSSYLLKVRQSDDLL